MEGKIYGTYYHISYEYSKDLGRDIIEEMKRVDNSLSIFNPSSLLSKLNNNEIDTVDVLFCRIYHLARKVYDISGGTYDITIAPLVRAWGFGTQNESMPDSVKIDSLKKYVGMDKLILQDNHLMKNLPEIQIDASSVAKGLGVDLVAEYMDGKGIKNYMVEIGGEVRVKGQSDKKRTWRIGIDRPFDDVTAQSRQLQSVIAMDSGALATSGNYRNFYVHDGKKYAHTINPITGYPMQLDILGASVYTNSCAKADAYATAFMTLGYQKSKEIVEKDPELEACLIYQDNKELKIWFSEGLKEKVIPQTK